LLNLGIVAVLCGKASTMFAVSDVKKLKAIRKWLRFYAYLLLISGFIDAWLGYAYNYSIPAGIMGAFEGVVGFFLFAITVLIDDILKGST